MVFVNSLLPLLEKMMPFVEAYFPAIFCVFFLSVFLSIVYYLAFRR